MSTNNETGRMYGENDLATLLYVSRLSEELLAVGGSSTSGPERWQPLLGVIDEMGEHVMAHPETLELETLNKQYLGKINAAAPLLKELVHKYGISAEEEDAEPLLDIIDDVYILVLKADPGNTREKNRKVAKKALRKLDRFETRHRGLLATEKYAKQYVRMKNVARPYFSIMLRDGAN